MKLSQILNNTLRKEQVSNDIISFQLLVRAGYFRASVSGDYQERHLGCKLYEKLQKQIENIVAPLHGAIQNFASLLPYNILHTLNYNRLLDNAVNINSNTDKYINGIPSVTVAAEIAHFELNTYKQLPVLFYDFQSHIINRNTAKGGLAGIKNEKTAEIISFSKNTKDQACIKEQILTKLYDFLKKLSVSVISIKSSYCKDEETAETLLYENARGNVSYIACTYCQYKADGYAGSSKKTEYTGCEAKVEKVYTPSVSTIEELAKYLKTKPYKCGKVVFFTTITKQKAKKIVMAIVRGDTIVNEHKLKKHLNLTILKPATEVEIEAIGAVAGYASAVGIDRKNTILIVDKLVAKTKNLITGANEKDYHLLNVCYGRDFKTDEIADIIEAEANEACPVCGKTLEKKAGIAIADVISYKQLKYKQQTIEFTNTQGKPQAVCCNYIRLSLTNLIVAVAEQNYDDDGLQFPMYIAPYQVVLLTISKSAEVTKVANKLYRKLTINGINVLYDDRDIKSAGIKFKDADLTGIPIRLTISPRGLKDGTIECRIRNSGNKHTLTPNQILPFVEKQINAK